MAGRWERRGGESGSSTRGSGGWLGRGLGRQRPAGSLRESGTKCARHAHAIYPERAPVQRWKLKVTFWSQALPTSGLGRTIRIVCFISQCFNRGVMSCHGSSGCTGKACARGGRYGARSFTQGSDPAEAQILIWPRAPLASPCSVWSLPFTLSKSATQRLPVSPASATSTGRVESNASHQS